MSKTTGEKADFGGAFKNLEVTLEEYLVGKAPSIPKEWKEIIVKFSPYLAILGVVMGVPGVLALLGAGTVLAPLGFVGGMMTGRPFLGLGFIINVLFMGVMILLQGLAIPGLFSRSKKAWTLLYWSALLGIVQNVISFNVGGLIIGGLVSMYVL
ncbi:MAG: hypothetical protein NUV65_03525, partial [Candidatus Roizmanbacteria bacterium]|nr:hypothetical protein [Candidatus Roizmanbacteria bacterium]